MLRTFFPTTLTVENLGDPTELDAETLADLVVEDALKVYEAKEERFGAEAMRELERWVLLRTIDSKWRDHLYEMDYLREGIGLRALAQRDPLVEYKNEGFKHVPGDDGVHPGGLRPLPLPPGDRREEQPRGSAPARPLAYSGGGDSSLAQNFAGAAAAAAARPGVADSSAEAYEAAQQATRTVVAPRSVQQGGAQRPLSVRQRQEVQEVLRGLSALRPSRRHGPMGLSVA